MNPVLQSILEQNLLSAAPDDALKKAAHIGDGLLSFLVSMVLLQKEPHLSVKEHSDACALCISNKHLAQFVTLGDGGYIKKAVHHKGTLVEAALWGEFSKGGISKVLPLIEHIVATPFPQESAPAPEKPIFVPTPKKRSPLPPFASMIYDAAGMPIGYNATTGEQIMYGKHYQSLTKGGGAC